MARGFFRVHTGDRTRAERKMRVASERQCATRQNRRPRTHRMLGHWPRTRTIMGLAVAAMIAVHLVLTRTRLGKAMRATAANPGLAQASGIATDRVVDIADGKIDRIRHRADLQIKAGTVKEKA